MRMRRIATSAGDAIRFLFAGVGLRAQRAVVIVASFLGSVSPFEWLPYLREDRRPRPTRRRKR